MAKEFKLLQTANPNHSKVFIKDLPETVVIASIDDLLELRKRYLEELIVNLDSIEIYNWYRE